MARKVEMMPAFILKDAPGGNLYMEYSEVVDAPTTYPCGRDEAVAEWGEEIIARADKNGSSDRMGFYWWGKDSFQWRECNPTALETVTRQQMFDEMAKMEGNEE